ncbi:alpha/beta hydrolase [Oxalobacteraceae bacterium]|nr:alpha/beta hydrolase [Oxalobacteraceae bacterium]
MPSVLHRFGDYLLQRALESESKKARLAPASVQLSCGHIEYLHSTDKTLPAPEAILVLHGAAANKTTWVRFARHFHNRHPLIIPDLPGHGNSVSGNSLDFGIAAQAARVKELLALLRVKRVHIIGSSMGGAIALHLAATEPALVSSLVLIDTAGVEARRSWLREHVAQTGSNPMMEVRDVADFRTMLRVGMERPPYLPRFIMAALARDFLRRRAINGKVARDIERDMDQTGLLASVAAPSLIIWGAADRVLHVDNAGVLHQRLSNSRKLVLEGVGHVPMVEAPRKVAAACVAFYAEISR